MDIYWRGSEYHSSGRHANKAGARRYSEILSNAKGGIPTAPIMALIGSTGRITRTRTGHSSKESCIETVRIDFDMLGAYVESKFNLN